MSWISGVGGSVGALEVKLLLGMAVFLLLSALFWRWAHEFGSMVLPSSPACSLEQKGHVFLPWKGTDMTIFFLY